ncbi:dTDP-4-dehydrorhamnose 3,5-epimerase [hydrothermal vent metagenome]|uniref:dTDP-4-dehydrorhamnose 3,5-epimerase n=1 Tax=hydrothermal vent metagenome TaxID=652676 RepID=A0A3B0Y791_9ZZZZ
MGKVISKKIAVNGVLLTPLKIITVKGGNVLHGMKSTDPGYEGFGETYFSVVEPNAIKAWKRHHQMTLNLIVPIGAIRFVIYDGRQSSSSYQEFSEVTLSTDYYFRLTVPPMIWMGFQGVSKTNSMLLNVADIAHTSEEADRQERNEIKYDWELGK